MAADGFLWGAVALLGLVVGSFLNVVIHRLPRMLEAQWAAASAHAEDGAESPAVRPYNIAVPGSQIVALQCEKEGIDKVLSGDDGDHTVRPARHRRRQLRGHHVRRRVRDGDRGGRVVVRATLQAREDGLVDLLRELLAFAHEDHAAARAAQRLVRRRRDELGIRHRARMQSRRDEPGDERHDERDRLRMFAAQRVPELLRVGATQATEAVARERVEQLLVERIALAPWECHSDRLGQTLKVLERAAGFLQHEVGVAIKMRYTPKLQFELDDSLDKDFEIGQVIRKIEEKDKAA